MKPGNSKVCHSSKAALFFNSKVFLDVLGGEAMKRLFTFTVWETQM